MGLSGERKRAEENLKVSEDKFRSIIENAVDVIFIKDKARRYTFVNQPMKDLLGLSEEEILGKTPEEVFGPEQGRIIKEVDDRAFSGETVNEIKSIIINDKQFFFNTIQSPLSVEDGEVTSIMGIVRDVTELKQTEEALIESEERFRGIVERSFDAIGVVNLEGKLIYVSPAGERISGYSAEELLGSSFRKHTVESDIPKLFQAFTKGLKGGITEGLLVKFIKKDGSIVDVETNIAPIFKDGKVVGVQALYRDITKLKRVEEELKKSEERFRGIVERSFNAISVVNLEGQLIYASPAVERITGYSPEELKGKPFQNYFVESDIPKAVQAFTKVIKGGTTEGVQLKMIKKDGSTIYIESNSSPILKDGKVVGIQGIYRDITKLKQAEEALKESEQRFRGIVERSFDAIVAVNLEKQFIYVSPAVERITGYSPQELLGNAFQNYFVKSDIPKAIQAFTKLIKGSIAEGIQLKMIKKDGAIIDIEANGSPILTDGKVVGLQAIYRDITKLKKAEKALKESEERFRGIVERSFDTIVVVNLEGHVIYASPAVERTMGYSPEELMGKHFQDYVIESDIPKAVKSFTNTIKKGIIESVKLKMIKKDGSIIDIESNSSPILKNGKMVGIQGIFRDVTKQNRAEMELRKSEEKYRILIENANDAIFIAQDGVIKFPNPKAKDILGYSEKELAQIPFTDPIHPEDRDMILDRHRKRLAGEEVPSTYSFRIINKTGEELWMQINTVLINWEGRPATLNFLRDITQLRKMEARFQNAQRMESLGTLAGGIAHDFNNLLMGIQGNASLMLLNKDSGHPDYERLKNIERYIQNGADLTRQLLGFARGGKYEVKPTDINELIKTSSQMFGRTKKEIKIHGKYQKDLWTVEVDQGQIEQVLLNLYVNAWQAMPGGGELYLETQNVLLDKGHVEPFQIQPGKYVKLSITDVGVGMDEAVRQRIFEPFFTTKDMGRGIGLGLASAYGIIKNHGGFINVYSEKGEGTTFTIYLPASGKEVVNEKRLSEDILRGTETVLLVDDEEMIIDVGEELLMELGYTVLIARSGKETIKLFKKKKDQVDLIILDMIMPDMGGRDVYDRLKQISPHIKVLLSSGYSINGQAQAILDRGCNGFIQKPFNIEQLSRKVREILDEKVKERKKRKKRGLAPKA